MRSGGALLQQPAQPAHSLEQGAYADRAEIGEALALLPGERCQLLRLLLQAPPQADAQHRLALALPTLLAWLSECEQGIMGRASVEEQSAREWGRGRVVLPDTRPPMPNMGCPGTLVLDTVTAGAGRLEGTLPVGQGLCGKPNALRALLQDVRDRGLV